LHENQCIRTQKKQKVFYWFSVNHDKLFLDALDRDLKRESQGQATCTSSHMHISPKEAMDQARDHCLPARESSFSRSMPRSFASQESFGDQFDRSGSFAIDQPFTHSRSFSHDNSFVTEQPYAIHTRSLSAEHPFSTVLPAPNMQAPTVTLSPPQNDYQSRPFYSSPELTSSHGSAGTDFTNHTLDTTMFNYEMPYFFDQKSDYSIQSMSSQDLSALNVLSSPEGRKAQFTCPYDNCGREFKRHEHLRRHVRSHTGEKPYLCPQPNCGRQFARSDHLAGHVKTHTDEYPAWNPAADQAYTEPAYEGYSASYQPEGFAYQPKGDEAIESILTPFDSSLMSY
jgi:uncharacterized Zn-finger protein